MNKNFEDWLEQLDKLFVRAIQLNHTDVEDYNWYGEWKSGSTPLESFDLWYIAFGEGV